MIIKTLVSALTLSAVLISSPPASAKGGPDLQERQAELAAELEKSRRNKGTQSSSPSFFGRLFGTAPQATSAKPATAAPKK